MSSYDYAASSGRVACPAAAMRVARAVAGLYRAWQNRRAFYRLGELSDVELADIGLTRSDLHVAVDAPFGSDPTVRLRAITEKRFDLIENPAGKVA